MFAFVVPQQASAGVNRELGHIAGRFVASPLAPVGRRNTFAQTAARLPLQGEAS